LLPQDLTARQPEASGDLHHVKGRAQAQKESDDRERRRKIMSACGDGVRNSFGNLD
jgi:hypothetical protein